VWPESNGRFDTAAELLGVHRHTVRNRIRIIEQLLSRDLQAFAARADIWAALLATAGN
jgi:purine catabolism regulator